jgi:hypothetical protein
LVCGAQRPPLCWLLWLCFQLTLVCWCWRKVFGLRAAVWIVIVEMKFVLDKQNWWYLV